MILIKIITVLLKNATKFWFMSKVNLSISTILIKLKYLVIISVESSKLVS